MMLVCRNNESNEASAKRVRPITCRHAFTLVELLVVIGIIAVLIAILLPALNKARQQANQVACLSNMRQLLIGITAYATDNNNYLPYAGWNRTNLKPCWLYTRPTSVLADWDALLKDENGVKTGTIYPYLKSTKIFRCPSDRGPYPATTTRRLTSYLMNGETCSATDPAIRLTVQYKMFQFKPRSVIMLEYRENSDWDDGSNNATEGIPLRHNKGGAVGTIEGAVLWIQRTSIIKADIVANRPNQYWCDPKNNNSNKWQYID